MDNRFDELTSTRIRRVSMFYRLFTCYSSKYVLMNDEMFTELQNFVFYDFN